MFGTASVMNLIGDKPETMVVKANVGLAAAMATLGQRYPGSLMGTMAFFRQALLDATHHRAEVAAYEKSPVGRKRPGFDPGLDAWSDVATGAVPLLLQTPRTGDLRRAFGLADEFKLKLILAGNTKFLAVFDRPQLDALAYLFLRLHSQGIVVASIFWGLWLFPFGALVIRSGFIPRVFGVLLIIAGVAYVSSAFTTLVIPRYASIVSGIALPFEVAELPIVFWLLIWGAKTPPVERDAIA